jgi:hypothetical protein
MSFRAALAAAALAALALAAPAQALLKLPTALPAVKANPADRLLTEPIEESVYDPATHCTRKRRPGMAAFQGWLEANAAGASWGTYRCELWGKRSASLHAEGRALDWHLDASVPSDRRPPRRDDGVQPLLALLLQARQAPPPRQPHGRAPRSHPLRADEGRRRWRHVLLAGRVTLRVA